MSDVERSWRGRKGKKERIGRGRGGGGGVEEGAGGGEGGRAGARALLSDMTDVVVEGANKNRKYRLATED